MQVVLGEVYDLFNPHPDCPDDPQQDLPKAEQADPQTPIILDMNGNGVELTSLQQSSALFDMDNDGFAELTGWVTGGDALLVHDTNGNGTIDDRSELFGAEDGYSDGFDKLGDEFDSNGDGVIDANDANFNQLQVWQDANENGISSAAELQTLTEAGITSISLAATGSSQSIAGHDVLRESTFVKDGQTRDALDIVFNLSQSNSAFKLPDNFVFDPDVFALPQMRGFGNTKDLWVAMSEDATLKGMVRTLVDADYSNFNFADFRTDVKAILERWTGADQVSGSDHLHFDLQDAAVVEGWIGTEIDGFQNNKAKLLGTELDELVDRVSVQFLSDMAAQPFYDAIASAATIFNQLVDDGVDVDNYTDTDWNNAFGSIFTDAQTAMNNHPLAFMDGINYDFIGNRLTGDFAGFVQTLEAGEPTDTAQRDAYWNNVLPVINAVADSQNISDADFNAALAGTYLDGVPGDAAELRNHRIFVTEGFNSHLIGTSGNDYLTGDDNGAVLTTDRQDTYEGGLGNDRMEDISAFGDDTYIYNAGDGNDTINDQSGDNDVLILNGYSINDVTFRQAEYEGYFQDYGLTALEPANDNQKLRNAA